VLDELRTGTLVSLAQICDDDCLAVFSKFDVKILKKDQVIITGVRSDNGLWTIPLHTHPHQANGILRLDKTRSELATYYHTTLGSPVPSTLLRAIRRGHLTTFPNLTTQLITKHLPKSYATTLGHQDQEAKNLRSTRPPLVLPPDDDSDIAPPLEGRSHAICAMLLPETSLLKSYSDQTGMFHTPSSRGNHYIFLLYNVDTNSIHTTAIPNRYAATIRDAWESTHQHLLHQGHAPELHVLDNECSADLQKAFTKYNVQFQRVPPKVHRVNAAERAIRTFKNHFVTMLCSVDSRFPLDLWDRLLPQATLTLNLLRSSRIHPSLSAYASLYGNFDFNRTPLAPVGTKILAHVNAAERTSFGVHGRPGWYIGPSLGHYRCWRCHLSDTHAEVDVLKVDFFPQQTPFPTFTREAYLRQTAEDMLHLLQPTQPTSNPPLEFGPPILNAYAKLADILRRAVTLPIHRPIRTLAISPPLALSPTALSPTTDPLALPAIPLPRVPASKLIISPPVAPPRVPKPIVIAPIRQSPRARLDRLHFDPRTHRRHLIQTVQLAVQYDPTIAGKMYHPVTGKAENIDSLLRGPDAIKWYTSLTNEWGRCAQGLKKSRSAATQIVGNNTIFFIKPQSVPPGRKITYATFVCTMRPGKAEQWRIRMTVGGDRLDAYQDVRSPAVGLIDTKLHLNSVISDAHRGARYFTTDLKDFFLQSLMKIFQYMRVHRRYLPQEIIDEYGLTDDYFDSNGYVYVEIRKGMYGLKEAAILAYDQLKANLAPFGYAPVAHTPGLWRHATRPTTFTLAVDDFGIKYFSPEDAHHLLEALRTNYSLTTDWSGAAYLGFKIDWDYTNRHVDISMPDYVPKALLTLRHPPPKVPQHAPHQWTAPVYGAKEQLATTDISPLLDKVGIHRVQQISGLFLYYSRGCDPTIIVALNEISNNQASPTEKTKQACNMLLDYLATHPNATIRYHASDMVLAICSDAAYLVLPKARSRAAGVFYLTDRHGALSNPPQPKRNGAVHVLCKTLRTVAASAAEAETGALFLNAQEGVPMRTALEEMGHPQPSTPLETDNSTAHGIINSQVRMRKSKAFDMRYHWLMDRAQQRQFNIHWKPGKTNDADYFSKHHAPIHHRQQRHRYLLAARQIVSTRPSVTSYVRGCVSPSGSGPPGSNSRTT
jgi:hypothetical protein